MKTDVRTSSLAAFDEFRDSGKMGTQAAKVWHWIAEQNRDCSLREISRGTGIDVSAVAGRVNALKHDGYLHEWPKRKCRHTGKTIIPLHVRRPEPEQLALLAA